MEDQDHYCRSSFKPLKLGLGDQFLSKFQTHLILFLFSLSYIQLSHTCEQFLLEFSDLCVPSLPAKPPLLDSCDAPAQMQLHTSLACAGHRGKCSLTCQAKSQRLQHDFQGPASQRAPPSLPFQLDFPTSFSASADSNFLNSPSLNLLNTCSYLGLCKSYFFSLPGTFCPQPVHTRPTSVSLSNYPELLSLLLPHQHAVLKVTFYLPIAYVFISK